MAHRSTSLRSCSVEVCLAGKLSPMQRLLVRTSSRVSRAMLALVLYILLVSASATLLLHKGRNAHDPTLVEMESTDPTFVDFAKRDALGLKGTLAERLGRIAEVPVARLDLRVMPVVAGIGNASDSIRWQVVVGPPTSGPEDFEPAANVAATLAAASVGPSEPQRRLLVNNGTWIWEPGASVRFLALLPGTRAALAGHPLPPMKDTSIPLGPNPGGRGAEAPPGGAGPFGGAGRPLSAGEVLQKAKEVNFKVYKSINNLHEGLKSAAVGTMQAMTANRFRPRTEAAWP